MHSFRSIVSIPITVVAFIIALFVSRVLFTLVLSIPYVGEFIENIARGMLSIIFNILSFSAPVAISAAICDLISDGYIWSKRISMYIIVGICIFLPLVFIIMSNSEFTAKSTYTISILLGGAVTAFVVSKK